MSKRPGSDHWQCVHADFWTAPLVLRMRVTPRVRPAGCPSDIRRTSDGASSGQSAGHSQDTAGRSTGHVRHSGGNDTDCIAVFFFLLGVQWEHRRLPREPEFVRALAAFFDDDVWQRFEERYLDDAFPCVEELGGLRQNPVQAARMARIDGTRAADEDRRAAERERDRLRKKARRDAEREELERLANAQRADSDGAPRPESVRQDSARTSAGHPTRQEADMAPQKKREEEMREELQKETRSARENPPHPNHAKRPNRPAAANGAAKQGVAFDANTSAHQRCVDAWCKLFREIRGTPYAFDGGKDGRHVQDLLGFAVGDVDLVIARARALLTSRDPYFLRSGVDLGTLRSNWNKLVPAPDGAQVTKANRWSGELQRELERESAAHTNGHVVQPEHAA